MTKRTVAIQGIEGCNHYIAARAYFAGMPIEMRPCDTFREMAAAVAGQPETLAMMAIENTIAGSLLPNYRLIRENDLEIIGEYKLRISHALAALPGTQLGDIREVNSHPMALMQCAEYLDTLPGVKLVEKEDTAGSAQWIRANGLHDHAAICPVCAAEIYGLEVLAEGIETNKRNFTRFLVLANRAAAPALRREIAAARGVLADAAGSEDSEGLPEELAGLTVNKSSLVFTLPHASGSLSKVLSILSFYDMNLSMIQSLPIVGQEWEYQFYINLLFADYRRYRQAVDAIVPLTGEFQILGEYAEHRESTPSVE